MYLADPAYNADLACNPNSLVVGEVVNLQPVSQEEVTCVPAAQSSESGQAEAGCPEHYTYFTRGENWNAYEYLIGQGMTAYRAGLIYQQFESDLNIGSYPVGAQMSLPGLSMIYCMYPMQ